MAFPKILPVLVCLCLAAVAQAENPPAAEVSPEQVKFFESKIRPLLVEHCLACHGAEKQSGGLRLDLKTSALGQGGESGPAIVPGHPEESLLLEAVRYESFEMPPEGPLPADQITLLETWIKQGAPWPDDRPDQLTSLAHRELITEEDRNYWAFQPPREPEFPTVRLTSWPRQQIDHFILARLEQEQLAPARPADKLELVRRVYLDVIGLPPTPAQVRAFLADDSPSAYEKLVDALLASPGYGEHMARHWLDLVRYAESDGYRQDAYRPQAWRYRDYVIEAFNSDMPYDQFLTEQLAGDELPPGDPRTLVATGFLRHGVYEYNQRDVRTHWQDIVNEMTDVASDVFLGLGMGCARCHNHKFDPILQEDYFALQAFFAPVFWEDKAPLATPAQIAEYEQQLARWEEATRALRARIDEIEAPHYRALAESSINRFPPDIQEMIRKPVEERSPLEHQLASLAERQVNGSQSAVKSRLKGEVLTLWEDLQLELDKFNALKPAPLPQGPTIRDVGNLAPVTVLSTRRETREIAPRFLTVLGQAPPAIVPPAGQSSTGRRLALANWLTRPDHPLTARVMVNRIWQQHFGVGLVSSASDFGTLGEPPSHPELLDWLALRFIDTGWSLKQMHRQILLSATYRQTSRLAGETQLDQRALLVDPHNRLLWRMRSHRLNADQIRDSILSSTGELNVKAGGPSVVPEEPRRSIYTKVVRNNQHPFFTAFDAPRGTSSTSERNSTTTSTQALLLINGNWMLQRANLLARNVLRETASEKSEAAWPSLIEELYWRTVRRPPGPEEIRRAEQYIRESLYRQTQASEEDPAAQLGFAEMPQRSGFALDLSDKPEAARPAGSSGMLKGDSDFSLEAVVYLRSMYPTSSVRTIISQWNNNQNSPGWSLGVTSEKSRYRPGNLILQLIGETAAGKVEYEVIPSNIHLALNNPYYVAVTVSLNDEGETGITFYVKNLATNDPLESSTAVHRVVRGIVDPGTRLVIGGRDFNGPQSWDGLLDAIRISSARLSEEELSFHREAVGEKTVADWHFEPRPGPLKDSSPWGNHLMLNRATGGHPLQEPISDIAHMLLNSNEFLYVD